MTEQQTARRFPVLAIIAFVLVAALLLTLAILSTIKGVRTAAADGNVVRVQDGQTLVVNKDGTEETVTLAGVMAPVPASEGQDPTVENCLAEESTANLAALLEPGDTVRMEYPDETDGPNGTRLALVHHDGQVTNIQQVEAGLAVPLREQPVEHLGSDLREAHETAREDEVGLYSPAEACTLAGQIAPAVTVLQDLPEERPTTSEAAAAQIETIETAVEQGITAEKVFATIDPEGGSLASLAWGPDLPRLQERLGGALSSAQSELEALESTRNVLATREREEEARLAEEARKAEAARQEAARQEAARQEAARQEAAREEARREAERHQAEAEASAEAEESESPSPSPTPTPTTDSPTPTPTDSTDSATPGDSGDSGTDD